MTTLAERGIRRVVERSPQHPGQVAGAAARLSYGRREGIGALLLLGTLMFVAGAAWDIQWHLAIGRDRPFIPPHLLLLAGIAFTGLVSLGGVFAYSIDVSRSRRVAGRAGTRPGGGAGAPVGTVTVARVFHAPLGAYVAGLGVLCSAAAFPLDDLWHRLYGLDVTLWAPFHIMIVAGMAVAALGTALVFAPPSRESRGAAIGVVLSLAMVAAVLLVLQAQALDRDGLLRIGGRPLVAYPPLVAALTIPWLVAAAIAFPYAGGATLAAAAITAVRWALFQFVPPALFWAAALEGQVVRASAPPLVATPFAFPAWALVAGLVIDAAWWLVRRRTARTGAATWRTRVPIVAAGGVVASAALALLDRPWAATLPLIRAGRGLDAQAALLNTLPFALAAGAAAALLGLVIGLAIRRLRV